MGAVVVLDADEALDVVWRGRADELSFRAREQRW